MPIPLGILAVAGAGAGGGPAYDLLETQVLGTAVASVTFSGLGSYADYKHLQIRATIRSTAGNPFANSYAVFRINGDSGTNYSWHVLSGNGSSVSSSAAADNARLLAANRTPAATAVAGAFAPIVIDALDFSNTSKNKTFRTLAGMTANVNTVDLISGVWRNTAAVTSIQFIEETANFAVGSRFSLYGVK